MSACVGLLETAAPGHVLILEHDSSCDRHELHAARFLVMTLEYQAPMFDFALFFAN